MLAQELPQQALERVPLPHHLIEQLEREPQQQRALELLEARLNQLQLLTRLDRDFQEQERLPGWLFRYSASTERLLQFPLQSDSHYLHH